MLAAVVIENENKRRGWSDEEAAKIAQLDFSEFMEIAMGKKDPSYEQAIKLAEAYGLPLSLFTSSGKQPIYINSGSGNNNNSVNCYIGTYSVDSNLKELVKDLISAIKPDIVWPENGDNSIENG